MLAPWTFVKLLLYAGSGATLPVSVCTSLQVCSSGNSKSWQEYIDPTCKICSCVRCSRYGYHVGYTPQVVVASGDRVLVDSVSQHGAFMTPARILVQEVKQVIFGCLDCFRHDNASRLVIELSCVYDMWPQAVLHDATLCVMQNAVVTDTSATTSSC